MNVLTEIEVNSLVNTWVNNPSNIKFETDVDQINNTHVLLKYCELNNIDVQHLEESINDFSEYPEGYEYLLPQLFELLLLHLLRAQQYQLASQFTQLDTEFGYFEFQKDRSRENYSGLRLEYLNLKTRVNNMLEQLLKLKDFEVNKIIDAHLGWE